MGVISLDSWILSAKRFYEEAYRDVPVDPRAEAQMVQLFRALPEACRDVEVQANEEGGALLIIDNLPKTRRVIIEVHADGIEGEIKLIDQTEVQRQTITFPESDDWFDSCVDWISQ